MKSSAIAGSLAALAGMFGKLGADDFFHPFQTYCDVFAPLSFSLLCSILPSILRIICIVCMIATNGLMLKYFVQGLHETDSLTATVTSAALNFLLSAIGGHVLFQEHLPMQWFVGMFIILSGMAFILHGDIPETKSKQS